MRPLVALALLASVLRAEEGWTELFDGKTLEGWTTVGGRYDGKARWSVEDGAITGRQGPQRAGGLIYTTRAYRNFELELEAFVAYPFDSGIFLRMRPDKKGAQVTIDDRPGGEIAGIYSEGWWCHNPEGRRPFRRGRWNNFFVRCVGDPMHIQVWINGEPVTDFRFPEGARDFAADGLIGLQVHGARSDPVDNKVMFRRLRVRPLPEGAGRYFAPGESGLVTVTPAGEDAGWRPLFREPPEGSGYRVRDGVLELLADGREPFVRTAEEFRDFHVRLDFKVAHTVNSGLFLRAAPEGDPAHSGCEIQIRDDFNPVTGLRSRQGRFTGGLYGVTRSKHKAPFGEWNTLEVTYRGSRLVTALNGKILYDIDTFATYVDPPFRKRAPRGWIGLERRAPAQVGGEAFAWFRNLFIRPLGK